MTHHTPISSPGGSLGSTGGSIGKERVGGALNLVKRSSDSLGEVISTGGSEKSDGGSEKRKENGNSDDASSSSPVRKQRTVTSRVNGVSRTPTRANPTFKQKCHERSASSHCPQDSSSKSSSSSSCRSSSSPPSPQSLRSSKRKRLNQVVLELTCQRLEKKPSTSDSNSSPENLELDSKTNSTNKSNQVDDSGDKCSDLSLPKPSVPLSKNLNTLYTKDNSCTKPPNSSDNNISKNSFRSHKLRPPSSTRGRKSTTNPRIQTRVQALRKKEIGKNVNKPESNLPFHLRNSIALQNLIIKNPNVIYRNHVLPVHHKTSVESVPQQSKKVTSGKWVQKKSSIRSEQKKPSKQLSKNSIASAITKQSPMYSRNPDCTQKGPEEAITMDFAGPSGVLDSPSIVIESGTESVIHHTSSRVPPRIQQYSSQVFKFDSYDRARYDDITEENEEVFSPTSPPFPDSPYPSHLRTPADSLNLSVSPLRIKEPSIDEEDIDYSNHHCKQSGARQQPPPEVSVIRSADDPNLLGCSNYPPLDPHRLNPSLPHSPCSSHTTSSPHTPSTPISPSSGDIIVYCPHEMHMTSLYRRRSHSETDLQLWDPAPAVIRESVLRHVKNLGKPLSTPKKGGSLESDTSSPQDSPLDLSMRTGPHAKTSSTSSSDSLCPPGMAHSSSLSSPLSPLVRGIYPPRSPGAIQRPPTPHSHAMNVRHNRESVAFRYNLEMPQGAEVTYDCTMCNQSFSVHDRLAKHIASCHKNKLVEAAAKAYMCDVCKRSFARSDMLTRHYRLHSGIRPYMCRICNQGFSRSDHLATHQRTHTGEKPYKCPSCNYAACRRDMITRHMRTHVKSADGRGESSRTSLPERSLSDESLEGRNTHMIKSPSFMRHNLIHQKHVYNMLSEEADLEEQEQQQVNVDMGSPSQLKEEE